MSEIVFFYKQEIKLRKEMFDYLQLKLIEIQELKCLFGKAQDFEAMDRFRIYEKETMHFIELLGHSPSGRAFSPIFCKNQAKGFPFNP